MASLLYLLRNSSYRGENSLFSFHDPHVIAIAIEQASGDSMKEMAREAEVIQAENSPNLSIGQSLTYDGVLDIVLKERTVIVL